MQTDLIIVSEYCRNSNMDPSFIILLEKVGLIRISMVDGEQYIGISQLKRIEQYARMYYELSINMEGIDAISNLLGRIGEMQEKINYLQRRLRIYESSLPDEDAIEEILL